MFLNLLDSVSAAFFSEKDKGAERDQLYQKVGQLRSLVKCRWKMEIFSLLQMPVLFVFLSQ
jgi:hypothetical protein